MYLITTNVCTLLDHKHTNDSSFMGRVQILEMQFEELNAHIVAVQESRERSMVSDREFTTTDIVQEHWPQVPMERSSGYGEEWVLSFSPLRRSMRDCLPP